MNDYCEQDLLFEPSDELIARVDALVEGALTSEQHADLGRVLADDPAARRWFVDYMQLHATLAWDSDEWRDASADVAAPSHSAAVPTFVFSTIRNTVGYFSSGWPAAYLAATVICGVGLTIAAFTYVSQPTKLADQRHTSNPQPLIPNPSSVVAWITGTHNCQWEKKGLGIRDRGLEGMQNEKCKLQNAKLANPQIPIFLVCLDDQLILSSGLMEITYKNGARVILQGPCTYEVDSRDGGYLSIGKLTARVEKSTKYEVRSTEKVASESPNPEIPKSLNPSLTTNHYPLFTIKTPTATITDLGTEFGVEVDKAGGTVSHVFQGSVRVHTIDADGKVQSDARVLHENEAVRVEPRSKSAPAILIDIFTPAQHPAFVRELPKPQIKTLDLVDVVAGGDGFSGRRDRGIDPASGRIVDALTGPDVKEPLSSDGNYHVVSELPFVDGVFIPDGVQQKVQIDSTGRVFDRFQGTDNHTWHPVWAGGSMQDSEIPTKIWDVDFNAPGHGLILLHASSAITFDLEAIRRANPGCKLRVFRAMAGNSDSGKSVMGETYSDFWVLVDAQVRFFRRQIRCADGAYYIMVPIEPSDRFLTLAATDGGDGISHDWIVFGDPRLEIVVNDNRPENEKQPH